MYETTLKKVLFALPAHEKSEETQVLRKQQPSSHLHSSGGLIYAARAERPTNIQERCYGLDECKAVRRELEEVEF